MENDHLIFPKESGGKRPFDIMATDVSHEIDNEIVITGSLNFTESADKRNAENIVIIKDHDVAEQYLNNWFKRYETSIQ